MKRMILVVFVVGIAAAAGVVRSYTRTGHSISEIPRAFSEDVKSQGDVRDEIRKSFVLSPGARVEVAGMNGGVKIETSDTSTAELYIERSGRSSEALQRRKITIENTPTSLTIHGEKGDAGFLSRLFGSSPTERVTLKLPRQVSLNVAGINGAVTVGAIDGAVEVHGINGKVEIAEATGSAEFDGINGNISVAIKQVGKGGINLNGINGNIELRLAEGVDVELEAHGMNGVMSSDLPNFVLERAKHGSYSAHIGSGGNSISAHGINGNIRLSRAMTASTRTDGAASKS